MPGEPSTSEDYPSAKMVQRSTQVGDRADEAGEPSARALRKLAERWDDANDGPVTAEQIDAARAALEERRIFEARTTGW